MQQFNIEFISTTTRHASLASFVADTRILDQIVLHVLFTIIFDHRDEKQSVHLQQSYQLVQI